jgi:hypothetical protein
MNKHKQHGFGLLLLAISVVLLGAIAFAAVTVLNKTDDTKTQDSTKASSNSAENNSKKQTDDLVLQNVGFDTFDNILYDTYALSAYKTDGLKGFYFFGDDLPGARKNPNFEFSSLKEGTKIIAAIDGTITFIKEQSESSDKEVFLQTNENSQWIIGYDHLVNVTVKKGDKVKAGDVLGEPGVQNNGLRRFEFQVNKKQSGQDDVHVCPTTLMASSLKEGLEKSMTTMMQQWNTLAGFTVYEPALQTPVGCLLETLTPQQAQGI